MKKKNQTIPIPKVQLDANQTKALFELIQQCWDSGEDFRLIESIDVNGDSEYETEFTVFIDAFAFSVGFMLVLDRKDPFDDFGTFKTKYYFEDITSRHFEIFRLTLAEKEKFIHELLKYTL